MFFLRTATLQIGPERYSMADGFFFDFKVSMPEKHINGRNLGRNLRKNRLRCLVKNDMIKNSEKT